ncbi:MAG: DUF4340 domain-containing protein [Spirochaetaceae bacterium]|jgi:hypothetical protein|nr:DUF4340 domain-containing protein [Spirochaetaceae bacterium]
MRDRQSVRIARLGFALALFTLLYGLSFAKKSGPRTEHGVLLNAPDTSAIAEITLTGPEGDSLSLETRGTPWRGRKGGIIFPLREDYATALIGNARKPRSLTPISESPRAHAAYSLTEESAFRMDFFGPQGSPLSSLLVGRHDYTGRLLAARSAGSDSSFYIDDDFSQSLSTESALWLDGRLFPSFAAPDAGAVQSLTLASGTGGPVLHAPEGAYVQILGLRSSRLIDPDEAQARSSGPGSVLRLESANGAIASLRIFPITGPSGPEYACVPSFIPLSPSKSGPESLRYGLVLSEWTYQRVLGLFSR